MHAIAVFKERWGAAGETVARLLAYVIAGHHAGLANWTPEEAAGGLATRLLGTGAGASLREYEEALQECRVGDPSLLPLPAEFELGAALNSIPGLRSGNPLALSMWVRLVFSALVDADFLDTEAFMDPARSGQRVGYPPLAEYDLRLTTHLEGLALQVAAEGRAEEPVMRARARVLRQCRDKAARPPGIYTLTVPTGGGKTLSSLAFALRHAVIHQRQRVIYAIPYTSIIEQTADVFGRIFGADAIVEHHSQADGGADAEKRETSRSRLACENWDAPLIVTTNVQLFESMFAARTSRCRKLHRITGSVIVLDEAQLLPPDFLQPILDALRLLVEHYGVTVLLCTATQPVLTDAPRFDPRQGLRGLPQPTPIVEDEAGLYADLRRVQIQWPADLHTPMPLDQLADELAGHECVLTIVNTRTDAADLMRLLDARATEPTLHLSAALCGQHRGDLIAEIRARLAVRRLGAVAGRLRPLRVVSTQLVEAGVDIDFPVVYRALAGLDSIAQAAGRCNREGALLAGALGKVQVFVRDIPKPLAALRHGAQATRSVRAASHADALTPATYALYFPLYHASFASRDRHGIVDLLSRDKALCDFAFRTAADKFQLVDDEQQASVIVPYRSASSNARDIGLTIASLARGKPDRWQLRKLQRYTVGVRLRALSPWQQRGDVVEMLPGLFLLKDDMRYDARLGLIPEGSSPDAASFVP